VRGPSVTGFSFDAVNPDDYEGLRPGYPEDAVAWLVTMAPSAHNRLVADVAAGTGKLTRMLAAGRGCRPGRYLLAIITAPSGMPSP
jgi:hypothetical protein